MRPTLTLDWFAKETLRELMNLVPGWDRPLRLYISDGAPGDVYGVKLEEWDDTREVSALISREVVAYDDLEESRRRAYILALQFVEPDHAGRWWYAHVKP